jgi:hypothetical protein
VTRGCALGRPQDAADLLGDEDGSLIADTTALSVARAKIALLQGDPRAAEAHLSAAGDIPGLADQLVLLLCVPLAEAALWNSHVDVALDACARGEAALIEEDQFAAAALLAVAVRVQADGVESGALDLATARAEADRLLALVEPLVVAQARLPEPDAHVVSALAERSRLDETPDPAAWQAATEAWAAIGRGYEAAHAGWRWAQAIAETHGERDQLTCVLLAAHERATQIGSGHLVDAIELLARRSRLTLPGMADSDGSAFPDLTPRERGCSRWSPTAARTARSHRSSSSPTRRRASTSPTSWASSARRTAARPRRSPTGPGSRCRPNEIRATPRDDLDHNPSRREGQRPIRAYAAGARESRSTGELLEAASPGG